MKLGFRTYQLVQVSIRVFARVILKGVLSPSVHVNEEDQPKGVATADNIQFEHCIQLERTQLP